MRKCLFIAIILIFTIIFVACENPFWNVENKCSHQYSEWTTKIEATCVEKEIQEKICSLCDDKQTQEIGEIDLATHIFDTIPATCTTDSIPGSCTREGCDEPNLEAVVLAGHDWNNWIQGTNATVVNPVGFETRTC
ncbi:MAG: hypothetical protein FWD22_01715, partial [Treponema sp.]|nr:hypothetical protein [Treponema sp.]